MTQRNLATAAEVDESIASLASQIIQDNTKSSNPLFIALLRGAAPFASKLMFEMVTQHPEYHPELDYMMVSTYGEGRAASEPRIVTDVAPSTVVEGRSVIILDDMIREDEQEVARRWEALLPGFKREDVRLQKRATIFRRG